ncbi:hypothetical protein P3S68_026792 [Capsicum galapagoense]
MIRLNVLPRPPDAPKIMEIRRKSPVLLMRVIVRVIFTWNVFSSMGLFIGTLPNFVLSTSNFSEEKFVYILSPSTPPNSYFFKGLSSMQTALCGKLVISCYHIDGDGTLFHVVYDGDANEVFTKVSSSEDHEFEVVARLLGAERIDDKTKDAANVLATTSVNSAFVSLLSSSKPSKLGFCWQPESSCRV